MATDASDDALAVARRNAEHQRVAVRFGLSDWYHAIDDRFDLIVSNPPYIAAGDPHLSQGDLRFEPVAALTDEADGLSDLAAIIDGAPSHLNPGGWLLMEHGHDQAALVREMLERAGWQQIGSWPDLAGIERVSGALRPAN
jgi:release factor glutamine methyltransferase